MSLRDFNLEVVAAALIGAAIGLVISGLIVILLAIVHAL